ncbi:MAG TPA: hypothetical protein VJ140_12080, partial [Actinomycetota bacterium]|nr:hypothetical protein [Actinomycetota bacterium]
RASRARSAGTELSRPTITSELGAYLVAAGLLGHAAWDVYHHRTNRVVVRLLAEFCLVLDTALAVAIVIVTVPR